MSVQLHVSAASPPVPIVGLGTADHTASPYAEFKDEWIFTSIPPYALIGYVDP